MDEIRTHGLLAALVPGTSANERYQQRAREMEFYQTVQEMMDSNPFFVLPENDMTSH
jgi:hypothetical protein